MRHAARMRQKGKNIMKAEIKFAITKNGPKAFMSTYNDDWTPANDTRLRVYKKDKRSVTPANAYPEGKGYALAINPWVLQDFLEVNGIDAMPKVLPLNCGISVTRTTAKSFGMSSRLAIPRSAVQICLVLKTSYGIGSITIARLCTATPRTRRMSASTGSDSRCQCSATRLSIPTIASSSWMIP